MNKSIQNAVLGYVSKESRQDLLGTGKHTVSIIDWKVLHSRIKWNGEEKETLPDFVDPGPQLGLMLGNDNGVVFYRGNLFGYDQWDDLTEEQKASGKFEKVPFGDRVYACTTNTQGNMIRRKNKKRTADAESYIDQLMSSINCTGKDVAGSLDGAVENKAELVIEVKVEEYNGKPQHKVLNFNRASSAAADSSEDEDFGK